MTMDNRPQGGKSTFFLRFKQNPESTCYSIKDIRKITCHMESGKSQLTREKTINRYFGDTDVGIIN